MKLMVCYINVFSQIVFLISNDIYFTGCSEDDDDEADGVEEEDDDV